jgi:uncharacterized membrane protein
VNGARKLYDPPGLRRTRDGWVPAHGGTVSGDVREKPMSHGSGAGNSLCGVCGKPFPKAGLIPGVLVREPVAEQIRRDHPDWDDSKSICRSDLALYRTRHVQDLLQSERGELTALDEEVLDSLRTHQVLSANAETEFEQKWTYGEQLADRIATFGGSWTFLIIFTGFLLTWIAVNSAVLFWHPVDPYPYILLNLMLSCLAAAQAPVIMMSQNRQEAKDRLRARNDYLVNLKAELEIRHLHEKIDHLLSHQWGRLVEIQEVQIDLLNELRRR